MPEPLAANFPPVDLAAWEAKARGDDADAPLTTPLEDGLTARFLYTRADELAPDPGGVPGSAPFVRGPRAGTAWEMRQEHGHAKRAAARAAILEDLEGGMTAITLRLDRAAREAIAPEHADFTTARGHDGIAVSALDDLDDLLDGVYLDLAPVALDAGAQALPAAALLVALWGRRGHDAATVTGSLGCDPLGTLAATGMLPRPAEAALARAGALAAEVAAGWPQVRALRVDTAPYVGAGATPALELAVAIATATTYLRACEAAGLSPERAAPRIEFIYNVGTDQFLEIAKLRAARRVWARVLEACSVSPDARWSPTVARTSARMLSTVDPWVNMLRVTTAAFAAVAGGADGVSVTPFDALRGQPDQLGRRIARNTQIVLADESHLAAVADPAGGSWLVEALTDDLARAAWTQLQELERKGGVLAALRSGALAEHLAADTARRAADLARRTRALTGVNAFPLVGDDGLRADPGPDFDALAQRERARLAERGDHNATHLRDAAPTERLAVAAALAAQGARLDELARALDGDEPLERIAALTPRRDAEPFERLRAATDAARASGGRPRVFLAGVGPLARHATPSVWARNTFGVAGLEAVESADPEALAQDGTPLAAVCASLDEEDGAIAATATALRKAGARRIYLVQRGDEEARRLGADRGVTGATDVLALLTDALTVLDITPA